MGNYWKNINHENSHRSNITGRSSLKNLYARKEGNGVYSLTGCSISVNRVALARKLNLKLVVMENPEQKLGFLKNRGKHHQYFWHIF